MDSLTDGGPAFPLQSIGPEFPPGHSGMSLRDWFAGQALTGILQNQNIDRDSKWYANYAYMCADEMIARREDKRKLSEV